MSNYTADEITRDLNRFAEQGEAALKDQQGRLAAKLIAGQELTSFDLEHLMDAQAQNMLAAWIRQGQKNEELPVEDLLRGVRRRATQAIYNQSNSTSLADRAQDAATRAVLVRFMERTEA